MQSKIQNYQTVTQQKQQKKQIAKIIQEPETPNIAKQQLEEKTNTDQNQIFQPFTFQSQVKIDGKVIYTIPLQMQYPQFVQQLKLKRPTRWGDRRLRKNNIIQDVVFNPVDGLIKRSSMLALTQQQSKLTQLTSQYAPIRKSKWGDPHQQTFKPPMLNYISPKIPVDQLQYIIRLLRLDQINSQMNFDIPDDPVIRAPSPQPIYNSEGRRINTRAQRKKMALQKQRIHLIQDCMRMRSSFKPPHGYRKQKKSRKVYIPETIMGQPCVNFIGKIIGPGGQTQKLLQQNTGCKIAIRGRGSNSRRQDIDAYDQLHIVVQAETDRQVQSGSDLVSKILMGTQDNQFKRQIALMNGITSEVCQNCNQSSHRTWACPKSIRINRVKCSICGQYSHPTIDCPEKAAYTKMQIQKRGLQIKDQTNQTKQTGLSLITDTNIQDKMIK